MGRGKAGKKKSRRDSDDESSGEEWGGRKKSSKKGRKRRDSTDDDDSDYEKPKPKRANKSGAGKGNGYTAPVKLTSELADTNHNNSARSRNEALSGGPVLLRRHRSSQNLELADCSDSACHSQARHSVHFDSLSHAVSGLETLDFPPRKKTWPPDGPR